MHMEHAAATYPIQDGHRGEFTQRVEGHVLEDAEGGGKGCSSLHDDLGYTGDIGDLGGEGRGNTGLCL